MSGQGHTAECRKRLEDVMMIKDLDDSGAADPSSSSGSGQHKHVRFSDQEHLDSKREGDTEMQTGGQKALVTRKRSAETDAERLEEESAETAEADSDKHITLKRKAEGDPSDSQVEDSAMNSLAELWHREDDPDGEVY